MKITLPNRQEGESKEDETAEAWSQETLGTDLRRKNERMLRHDEAWVKAALTPLGCVYAN